MDIPTEILDAILKNYQKPEDLMGEGGEARNPKYFIIL
jgi:hypothetical protein